MIICARFSSASSRSKPFPLPHSFRATTKLFAPCEMGGKGAFDVT